MVPCKMKSCKILYPARGGNFYLKVLKSLPSNCFYETKKKYYNGREFSFTSETTQWDEDLQLKCIYIKNWEFLQEKKKVLQEAMSAASSVPQGRTYKYLKNKDKTYTLHSSQISIKQLNNLSDNFTGIYATEGSSKRICNV